MDDDLGTNPLMLAWRSLPPNVRRAYASLPNALLELSPGAAIRDTLDAGGRMVKNALEGDGWGAAGAGANMLTAMAGVVPGGRAAGKGAKAATSLAMDEAARLSRAREMGFRVDEPLYHGTRAVEDFPAFSLARAGEATERPSVGVWAAKDPEYSNRLLDTLDRQALGQSGNPRILPLVGRSEKHGTIRLTGDENHHEIMATIAHVFATTPIDAIQMVGKGAEGGTWVFKNPAQLRSRFAAFDPAKKASPDLLAGTAGAAAAGSLGYNALSPAPPEPY